jgi:hypothetical protein
MTRRLTILCVALTPLSLGLYWMLSRHVPVLQLIPPLIPAATALLMLHKGERGYALLMALSALSCGIAGVAITLTHPAPSFVDMWLIGK